MSVGNLTTGQVLPGFYGYVDYGAQGSGQAPTRRVLLWGFIGAAAQATPNYPFMPASQQDANDRSGQGSDLARMYQAAIAQPESQGAEIWCMPCTAPSGGVASQYKLKVYVTNTNPAKAGTMQLWIASRAIPAVGFSTSDTASTIAASLGAQIATVLDLPIATASVSTDTVTITYIHKGAVGEELPFRCVMSPSASGVKLSPGQALFATSATGAGSVRVAQGSTSVSTTLAGAETAAQVATKVAASWNADTYALTAAVDGSTPAQVNFFFADGRDVRRMNAAVITSTGTTVNLGSGATDGTGSASSFSYNGTQGTGAPTVTSALANLATLGPYRSWASSWKDSTTIGALATNIENASDGSITGQKMQTLTLCSSDAASVAGAIATSSSPNLTATAPHYAVLWAPEAPVQEYEIASRIAAARAAIWLDTPQKNWNAFAVKGSDKAPILAPSVKQTPDTLNTALRTYALAPVVVGDSGYLEVVKGRTTSLASDLRLWAWSTEAQEAYHAVDLAAFLKARFQGGNIIRYSEPKAQGLFDTASVESAVRERMRFWEGQGNYDGAALLGPAVKATISDGNPSRFNVSWPMSPVLDLDQIVFVGHFTSPPSTT